MRKGVVTRVRRLLTRVGVGEQAAAAVAVSGRAGTTVPSEPGKLLARRESVRGSPAVRHRKMETN